MLAALGMAQRYYAIEGIHDLRVEIKRLRAAQKLVHRVALADDGRRIRRFKRLFKTAGVLRDLDIEQHQLCVTGLMAIAGAFFNALKAQEMKARPRLVEIDVAKVKRQVAACRISLGRALAGITAEEFRRRVDGEIAKSVQELQVLATRRQMSSDERHDVRKLAKEIKYFIEVREAACGTSAHLGSISKTLKAIYNALGEWRDLTLTAHAMREFVAEFAKRRPGETARYASAEAQLDRLAKARLRAFAASLRVLETGRRKPRRIKT
jgi:CHAD domain-containing protein